MSMFAILAIVVFKDFSPRSLVQYDEICASLIACDKSAISVLNWISLLGFVLHLNHNLVLAQFTFVTSNKIYIYFMQGCKQSVVMCEFL